MMIVFGSLLKCNPKLIEVNNYPNFDNTSTNVKYQI